MLVVARYNGSLDWLEHVDVPVLVYNKGESLPDTSRYSVQTLDNIGRESHTYLMYILGNYYNLPEYITFAQGNPFEHCRDFLDKLKIPPTQPFTSLSHWTVTEDLEGRPHAQGYGMVLTLEKLGIPLTVGEFVFGAGAQFTIYRDLILSKGLPWWISAFNIHAENTLSPWIFERLWPLIFNYRES